MFLDTTLDRNAALIRAALRLHRDGLIPPNSFVVDLDAVAENARLVRQAADTAGLSLYFTTKQIGFNPILARCVVEAGIEKAIAIDTQEAFALSRHNIRIGHVGHLVQTPYHMIGRMLELEPEVFTVFGVEKARQISEVAARDQRDVQLLLRVVSEEDFKFPGQEGGIPLDSLLDKASTIMELTNVRIVGVTAFPCLELDNSSKKLVPTNNFHTILRAAEMLEKKLGIHIEQINAPGNTCVNAMETLASMGATHGEPGHGLTGTTYLHAYPGQTERPAVVYVSEISHKCGGTACAIGGGVYRRAPVNNALVGSRSDAMVRTRALPLDPTAIEYYVSLVIPHDEAVSVGDTVIFASRAQIFVSRSYVAVVGGIQDEKPELVGLFDRSGNKVETMA
jgi:predicted amino acid racemase